MSALEGDWGAALDQQENELSGKVKSNKSPHSLVRVCTLMCRSLRWLSKKV